MGCYPDVYFAGLWGHENPQYIICAKNRTGFVVNFSNCPIFWVSKLQTDIALYTLYYNYVAFSRSVRALLPLKSIIKEVIENLGINSEKLKFLSISIVYGENNGAIDVATSPGMTPTPNHIAVKYKIFVNHRFRSSRFWKDGDMSNLYCIHNFGVLTQHKFYSHTL